MIIPQPFVRGPNVNFRPLEKKDACGDYFKWINDDIVRQFLALEPGHLRVEDLEAYIETNNASSNTCLLAVCSNGEGRHIGNVKLQGVDRYHRSASISIVIGARDLWGRGRATETIALMTAIAINQLGLERIDIGAYMDNPASYRAFLKCGYSREGLSRGQYILDGNRRDGIRLGLLASDPPLWQSFI